MLLLFFETDDSFLASLFDYPLSSF